MMGRSTASTLCLVVVFLLTASTWLLVGCGKSSTSVSNHSGEVRVPDDGNSYELWLVPLGSRTYAKHVAQPNAELDPGTYELVQYYVRNPKDTKSWVSVSPKRMQFEVNAGATTELNIGGPYTAQAKASTYGSEVSIDLAMTDCAGSKCAIVGVSAPKFQILSSSGDVLQEASFEYG